MSFSSDVKDEILKNFSGNQKTCCIKAEKFGEYLTSVPLKNILGNEFKEYLDISKLKECCIKSILKGVFLGSGCIVDPMLDYHFEVIFKNKACGEYILNLLSVLDFTPKMIKRKKQNVVYFKESEQISLFLSILGANNAVLKFEQIRVEKEVKNSINRTTNCETANLSKTINSAVKQIEAIKKLKEHGKFASLNDKLKYTANLRLKYPTESLDYIASKTAKDEKNKISKSGLKHRLDKLIQLAAEIK
ncbi:MAG: DNA-binding protein WhiA [Clostridia bacterium]|nr:DNA-binding protein WhiA [Clostridia bacterium]